MRCKKHSSDPSGAVGVCASCLHRRLLTLIDAQSQPLLFPPFNDDDCRRFNLKHLPHDLPSPPSLVFLRSVSRYISRRKSDTGAASYYDTEFSDDRFFSTPQVGPSASKAKKKSKFHLLSSLFRSDRRNRAAPQIRSQISKASVPISI